jgi:TRAP transporter TAXI family solute receptor
MDVIMQAMDLKVTDFDRVFELTADEQSQALCGNRIDAIVFMSGFPSGSIKEATSICAATLVDVEGGPIDRLVQGNLFYRKAVIPMGIYAGTDRDIQTFGTLATLITSSKQPDDVVYALVKAVFDNLDEFKKQHPAFKDLKEREMIRDGLSAPLHPGATRYYEQRGWSQHR